MYRSRRNTYGPRYGSGYGRGYGRGPGGFGPGPGRGRRFYSPNCDWYPDRPRGWWASPEYQEQSEDIGWTAPPLGARWDPYSGAPENTEAIEHEVAMIQKQIESLQKELSRLKNIGKSK